MLSPRVFLTKEQEAAIARLGPRVCFAAGYSADGRCLNVVALQPRHHKLYLRCPVHGAIGFDRTRAGGNR